MRWNLDLPDLAATERFAASLGPLFEAGDVITLGGDLGAGKTAFARALLNARLGPVEVPSPTFNLVLTYEGADGLPFWHFDLYRLDDPEEALELGIEEAFADAVSLIEWPERLGYLMPSERLHLTFVIADNGARRVTVEASPQWAARLRPLAHAESWTEIT